MKTPWKFLVQLASRPRPAKVQENPIGHAIDPEAIESKADQTSIPASDSTAASGMPDRDEGVSAAQVSVASKKPEGDPDFVRAPGPAVDAEEAQTPAESAARRSDAEAGALVAYSRPNTKSQRKPRTNRRERAKRVNADVVAQGGVATNEGQSIKSSSSGDAFFDEVASLDEEIKQLRSVLTTKLYLQNVQLKKMLARFDVL
ncbi:hypothetical protein OLZ32_37925 [Rhizobium sp. 1AS11]|uniref:hypothetical protein n=1 Tax=Rhizobium acaciae TaxID=2989736 RepID=UPI00222230EE|nr:hypothetical protein [Rhizobium acaciae]MCW1413731.1 hypothetical protein [Rhizobium acaciae]MCW1746127.1 hypothetical protein [Rhizobium acaciae]